MPWKINETDEIVRVGRSWTNPEGITHPTNWSTIWTDSEKTDAGLVWEDDPSQDPFDSTFYWGRQNDGTLIPKSLTDVNEVDENGDPILDIDGNQMVTKGLKTVWTEFTKNTANTKLSETDWYITRNTETGDAIPSTVTDYRAAVRAACATIEGQLNGAADLAAFMALFDIPVDADGMPTGPAPVNAWPDAI